MTAPAATAPLITVQSGPRNARTDPDSGLRFYTWDGQEYPSVTSVRRMAGLPLPLAAWQVNKVIERAITQNTTLTDMLAKPAPDPKAIGSWLRQAIYAERDAAADLGKRVHDYAAKQVPLGNAPNDVAPFLGQFYDWLSASGAEIIAVEQQCWNLSEGYAGTFDLITRFKSKATGGKYANWLWDLKTGKGTYPEHALQLEAYRRCEFVGEDSLMNPKMSKALRDCVGMGVLHLTPDHWTATAVPSTEQNWNAFLGILDFARWMHANPTLDTLSSGSRTGKVGP